MKRDSRAVLGAIALLLAPSCSEAEAPEEYAVPHRTAAGFSTPAEASSATGEGCGQTCCPLGWTRVEGSDSSDIFVASGLKTCVVAGAGKDTVSASPGAALFAYGGDGADELSGAKTRDGLIGGDGDDRILGYEMADFLDGGGGADELLGGDGPDLLLGGGGHDQGLGGTGNDKIHLGGGDDFGSGGTGVDHLYGGPGADSLSGDEGNDYLNGGPGNDVLEGGSENDVLAGGLGDDALQGGDGADILHGGPGIDSVDGGSGDDTIRIGSPCEVHRGEFIDGGDGFDTLYSHLSISELTDRGVEVRGIERVVQYRSRASNIACAFEEIDDGYVEIIARVSGQDTFWRTNTGDIPLDGRDHSESGGLGRHIHLDVELVSSSSSSVPIADGETISLFLPGGSALFEDGTGLDSIPCCFTIPTMGGRYRFALRWDRENDEYQYLTNSVSSVPGEPVAQLPEFGTIPFIPQEASFQAPGAQCPHSPEPTTFQSASDTLQWASMGHTPSIRWNQNVWLDSEEWGVARPIVSLSTTTNRECGDPEFGAYAPIIRDGGLAWSDSASLMGLFVPGESALNPYLEYDCNAGKNDGSQCIAVADVPQDSGTIPTHDLESDTAWSNPLVAAHTSRRHTSPPDDLDLDLDGQPDDWLGVRMFTDSDTLYRGPSWAWDECTIVESEGSRPLEVLAGHEMGHMLGLAHDPCPTNLMHEKPRFPGPQSTDIGRMRIYYPSQKSGFFFPNNIYVKGN